MIAYLCREYGWDKDYIGDTLTLEQIFFFYKEAKKLEMQAMRLTAVTIVMSVRTAMCGDKDKKFEEFLEKLGGEKKDLNEALDQAKKDGLPIEEN